MPYENLSSIYYKRPADWKHEYLLRFKNSLTRHFPLSIHQYGYTARHPLFYCYTEESALLQDKILTIFSGFQNMLKDIPGAGIKQFLTSCLVNEIKSSNDIEGVRSTRKEIRTALMVAPEERPGVRLGGIVGKYAKIIQEETFNFSTCEDLRSLFDEFIADEIRRSDPSLLPDGKLFRASSVDVVSATQKTIHRGLYPEEKIIQYMQTALDILNNPGLPYFNRIAIFHFLFGYIHPFYDGNGRMSRFITSCLLAQHLHPTIALQLSVLIKQQRRKYYQLFSMTESDINKGDLTPFIIGTLKFIHAAISYTDSTLRKKLTSYRKYQQKISALNLKDQTTMSIYDILLQASIFSDLGATSAEIQATIHKTENTVASRLKQIPAGVLKCQKSSRPYHYSLRLSGLDDFSNK